MYGDARMRRGWVGLFLVAGAILLGARPAAAAFDLVRQDVSLDRTDQTASFRLEFNQPPDFANIDSEGRPANSFQVFVNPDWAGDEAHLDLDYGQIRRVIRGDEIHLGDGLPVRDATPSSLFGAAAGGWGRQVAAVPFEVDGRKVAFDLPWSALDESDGLFSYSILALDAGTATRTVEGTSVPLPPAVWTGAATLAGLAACMALYRQRAHGLV